jgi:acetylornithine deacetylase/succinyl-diaminopimelate desuccinylase-like protein
VSGGESVDGIRAQWPAHASAPRTWSRNAIAARLRFSLDVRGPDDDAYRGVARDIAAFVEKAAAKRGMSAEYRERQSLPATPMDDRIVSAVEEAARATGEPFMRMSSRTAEFVLP